MDAAQATDHQTGSRRLVLPILRIATMSRRLGKRQTALLSALGSLGDAGESHWWKMSAIVNRYYGQSPDIIEREAEIGRRVNADRTFGLREHLSSCRLWGRAGTDPER